MTKTTRAYIDTQLARHAAGLISDAHLARTLTAEYRSARGFRDHAEIEALIDERIPTAVERLPNGALIAA